MNDTDSVGPTPSATAPPPPAARTSRLAIASLVLGILGFFVLPAVAGLVCGIMALVRIPRSAGALKGQGLALAGTIVSGLMLVLLPILAIAAAIALPAIAKARVGAQSIHGLNNVRQLCLAARLHASDHQDTFPAADRWCDDLKPYLGGVTSAFRRSGVAQAGTAESSSYGFNILLDGAKLDQAKPDTVLFFELRNPGWNVAGGPDRLRLPNGWGETNLVGFVDGHAEALSAGPRLDNLRWNP